MTDDSFHDGAPEIDLVSLAETHPKALLALSQKILKEDPHQASNLFLRSCRFLALRTLGTSPLLKASDLCLDYLEESQLRRHFTEEDLEWLDMALREFFEIQGLDEQGTVSTALAAQVDGIALIVERCRAGRVQTLLGWTKLAYFDLDRQRVLPRVKNAVTSEEVKPFLQVPVRFPRVIMSSLAYDCGMNADGHSYMRFGLFAERISDMPPDVGLGTSVMASLTIFDDGTYSVEC